MSVTIEEWIEALESGKFKQGVSRLFRDEHHMGSVKPVEGGHFCCIGVLGFLNGREDCLTPYIDADNLIGYRASNDVQYMNDTGKSFQHIANYLKSI